MMVLEELRIARNSQWSKEPGKFNGKAVFKGERGEVSLNLNDHHIEQIFLTCAASIEEVAKAAAKFLYVEVENQRAIAEKRTLPKPEKQVKP